MKLILLCTVFISLNCFAQDFQNITDLGFKPDKGQLVYNPEIGFGTSELSFQHLSGGQTRVAKYEDSESSTSHDVEYGLMKNLYLSVTLGYDLKNESVQKSDVLGTSALTLDATTDDKGLNDPNFGLVYRIYADEVKDNYFDLAVYFSPSIGDAERSSSYTNTSGATVASGNGNALRGGSSTTLAARYYGKLVRLEYELVGSFAMDGESTTKSLKAGKDSADNIIDLTSKSDSSKSFSFAINLQHPIKNKLYINGGFSFVSIGSQSSNYTNYSSSTKQTVVNKVDDYSAITVHLGTKYKLSGKIFVNASVVHVPEYDYKLIQTVTTTSVTTTEVDYERTSTLFDIGITFLF